MPKLSFPKFVYIFGKKKVREVEGECEGRSWNWKNHHINIEAKRRCWRGHWGGESHWFRQ